MMGMSFGNLSCVLISTPISKFFAVSMIYPSALILLVNLLLRLEEGKKERAFGFAVGGHLISLLFAVHSCSPVAAVPYYLFLPSIRLTWYLYLWRFGGVCSTSSSKERRNFIHDPASSMPQMSCQARDLHCTLSHWVELLCWLMAAALACQPSPSTTWIFFCTKPLLSFQLTRVIQPRPSLPWFTMPTKSVCLTAPHVPQNTVGILHLCLLCACRTP